MFSSGLARIMVVYIPNDNDHTHAFIRNADAICFDVDSTVCKTEGIDELAKWCGANDISKLTKSAMNGEMSFTESLTLRLNKIRPSKFQMKQFIEETPFQLSNGVKELVDVLQKNDKDIFLISGGFRSIIEPLALSLAIPLNHVYANTLLFDEHDGQYIGFDVNELTSKSGGKALAIQRIKEIYGYNNVVMIGDGITDLEANADLFIGYGGVCEREVVKQNADWFLHDFDDITRLF